jgi:lipopolysaccharide/colanic/teichoic acid biosynthesis glycosyltransferase
VGLDAAAAAVILIASVPVMAVAMILVRLSSPGPVIYSQRRVGRDGRTFTIYKIRTMICDSEPCGPRWCVPGDPRVTTIGILLRWSHVDELPQMINVLRGEMSLIGPRPERPEIVAQLERVFPDYRLRLGLRPGLSGLAQVLLPPDTEIDSVGVKLRYDLHYVGNVGPWLDLKIALATFFHLVNAPRGWIARAFRFPFYGTDVRSPYRHAEHGEQVSPSLSI